MALMQCFLRNSRNDSPHSLAAQWQLVQDMTASAVLEDVFDTLATILWLISLGWNGADCLKRIEDDTK